jgi:thioredoxin 1
MSGLEDSADRRQPSRGMIDNLRGPALLEFGASWCGHCRTLAPKLAHLLKAHPEVQHIKVEDGPGQPLGRSFGVKLWPTLVFMRDGRVEKQVARPEIDQIQDGLSRIVEG